MPPLTTSTGLTITNPLVLYRAHLATKRIEPDPAQHRLALHLQKLYHRLKDYQPEVDFGHRLKQINKLVKTQSTVERDQAHHADERRHNIYASLRGQKEKADATALTRRLTDHESAMQLQSPHGLLLYGEVGTGKSFLVDLLADCLPNRKKKRWHFNTFMLETFAKLEQLRKSRLTASSDSAANGGHDEEHSLLWLARDMISTSPILFLDEFQLPDRAASKILSNLFISFFHLGGVLIATSNRMPEELAKASGVEFTAPPSSRSGPFTKKWAALRNADQIGRSENMFAGKGEFAAFLEVLRARCEVWDMEGVKDWRRRETEEEVLDLQSQVKGSDPIVTQVVGFEPSSRGNGNLGPERILHTGPLDEQITTPKSVENITPKYYFVRPSSKSSDEELVGVRDGWEAVELRSIYGFNNSTASDLEAQWKTTSLKVYGRELIVPLHLNGVTKWTFSQLCGSNLGPADYITLASNFHTFVLTDVPVLTLLQKNEARRLITLLDALYEARCKLLLSAEAGPDNIFFPETHKLPTDSDSDATSRGDEVYSETFSEIYQDATSPFRPNVSSYVSSASRPSYTGTTLPSFSQEAAYRTILADEDSDFGPVYGAGRDRGVSDGVAGAGNEIGRQNEPDFASTGQYTGEDENFAFKRARSRLWEMCGSRWWSRDDEGWWRPLSKEVRRWESPSNEAILPETANEARETVKEGGLFRHEASPFRTSQDPPPKFGWQQ